MDLLSAEEQLLEALPTMARSATSKPLRAALQKHLKETRSHASRLKRALRALGEKPESKTCKAMQGLLEEANSVIGKTPEGALRDAVMITGAQKVEHYEMASYGSARTYAQVLGDTAVARLLNETLKEEKAADRTLTQIAKGSVNEEAAEEWASLSDPAALGRSAEWAGSAISSASRQLVKGARGVAVSVGVVEKKASSRRKGSSGKASRSASARRRTSTRQSRQKR